MSLEVKGVNGTITFDGAFVSIVRSGFLARATIGKGEKRIPVGHISSVQFKPAGLVRGFIQFSLAGGVERRSQFGRQSTDAAKDENSVLFTTKQQPQFEALRQHVERAMVSGPPPGPPPQSQRDDVASQLQRLAELHRSGALTANEFTSAKQALLRGGR
ncbi:DUF4429 domain-containing protein [Pseudonocardia sp.]|uniref:DUF4429 domain-containing protein n=1 Tax=Pseudonocardia sp. TaxID=60912 RepID=UPI0026367D28|nr:DUF4429 domain-containing protein [Pseudonocardia sp.]